MSMPAAMAFSTRDWQTSLLSIMKWVMGWRMM